MTNLILKAAQLAIRAHAGQVRKYEPVPYVYHPARVAGRTAVLPGATEEMVAAAYLHDVLEDTAISFDEIARLTSFKVAEYVQWMTNPSKGSTLPRQERKAMDRAHLKRAPIEVKWIKMLDRIDNLIDMKGASPDFQKLYGEESILLHEAIGDNTPLSEELLSWAMRYR